uniref:GATA-type domain-containing protein n=1 Tax=Aquila chrysaetos chrysaetos TaxID=223781 RepID=A0A663DQY5_AQUCH
MHPWAPPDFWLHRPSVRVKPLDLGLHRPSVRVKPLDLGLHCPSVRVKPLDLGLHRPSVRVKPLDLGLHCPSVRVKPLDLGLHCPSVRMHPWAPPDFWLHRPSVRVKPLDLGLHRPSVRMHPWAALSVRPPGRGGGIWGCLHPTRPNTAGIWGCSRVSPTGSKRCASCKTRRTPLWRAAENGTPLCNACGIRYKKYRVRCRRCWNIPGKSGTPRPQCPHCGEQCRPAGGGRR